MYRSILSSINNIIEKFKKGIQMIYNAVCESETSDKQVEL